eukprot:366008-Chlamydomonas_euryale.AAC.5
MDRAPSPHKDTTQLAREQFLLAQAQKLPLPQLVRYLLPHFRRPQLRHQVHPRAYPRRVGRVLEGRRVRVRATHDGCNKRGGHRGRGRQRQPHGCQGAVPAASQSVHTDRLCTCQGRGVGGRSKGVYVCVFGGGGLRVAGFEGRRSWVEKRGFISE